MEIFQYPATNAKLGRAKERRTRGGGGGGGRVQTGEEAAAAIAPQDAVI